MCLEDKKYFQENLVNLCVLEFYVFKKQLCVAEIFLRAENTTLSEFLI